MKKFIKTAAVLAVLMVASLALEGCNTVRGVGKDVKKGGQAIENSVSDVQYQNLPQHTIAGHFPADSSR